MSNEHRTLGTVMMMMMMMMVLLLMIMMTNVATMALKGIKINEHKLLVHSNDDDDDGVADDDKDGNDDDKHGYNGQEGHQISTNY